jgi:hypothetical protein
VDFCIIGSAQVPKSPLDCAESCRINKTMDDNSSSVIARSHGTRVVHSTFDVRAIRVPMRHDDSLKN